MRYLENVVTLAYDPSRCNGCANCASVCPHAVFAISEARAVLADKGACMECGACAKNCEKGAITVRAGVGCAGGIIAGLASGGEPVCGCSGETAKGPSSCC